MANALNQTHDLVHQSPYMTIHSEMQVWSKQVDGKKVKDGNMNTSLYLQATTSITPLKSWINLPHGWSLRVFEEEFLC